MHKPGGTIRNVLDGIASHEYVLPAIQREFVWRPQQVCNLFDSVMQRYPFGEFMFWRVKAQNAEQYRWYDFVRKYHQRDSPHCPELGPIYNKPLTAVLDGQQRLTAFNIGLRGSMAVKLPYKWWKSSDAFPEKVLALDLLAPPDPDEEGSRYVFAFVDENRIGLEDTHLWFRVSDIMSYATENPAPEMLHWITKLGLGPESLNLAFGTLNRLHQAICVDPLVAYYEEESQDIERVLSIFIRCNSGGTPLSYSNLLLSIAVSQWDNLDARKEVHGLVDELNNVRPGLRFDADFVLKAGLMLTDIASVGFKVANFTHENMATLEKNWPSIRQALQETVELVDSFGFDTRTLRATNSLLPIAYYLYKKGAPSNFEVSDQYLGDRKAIKGWLTRSILKESGIWGSGLDTLLTALREVIRNSGESEFPAEALRRVMTQRGKTLDFLEEEIEDLADMRLGDSRIFPLLTMLFHYLESKDGSDIDHVFPKSRFTPNRLKAAGVEDDQIDAFRDRYDRLANLQLLDHSVNNEKRATLPADWLDAHCADDQVRQYYCDRHLLGDVPKEINHFLEYYDGRRQKLHNRIRDLVNAV
ncbi:MAG: DUF262 domain-containing protein [bacterium]|nr:DUF262 domain-containing protein [bacterium]